MAKKGNACTRSGFSNRLSLSLVKKLQDVLYLRRSKSYAILLVDQLNEAEMQAAGVLFLLVPCD